MSEQGKKTPHWAWPHVIAVLVAIAAYYVIFRYTGDADILYTIAIAVAMGGAAWVAAWGYFFRAR
jgi:uncharacterized membrane protein HdeD (DUF308 family)